MGGRAEGTRQLWQPIAVVVRLLGRDARSGAQQRPHRHVCRHRPDRCWPVRGQGRAGAAWALSRADAASGAFLMILFFSGEGPWPAHAVRPKGASALLFTASLSWPDQPEQSASVFSEVVLSLGKSSFSCGIPLLRPTVTGVISSRVVAEEVTPEL